MQTRMSEVAKILKLDASESAMSKDDIPLALRIKQMILSEDLQPGERVTEVALSERLGVSRTPVRNILPRLAAEGFLRQVGRRGYTVPVFSDQEMLETLDLRASLEGWAAGHLARRGATAAELAMLRKCLDDGDAIFQKGHLTEVDEREYGLMNERFHTIIMKSSSSFHLRSTIERLNQIPFLAPDVIAFDLVGLREAFDHLRVAHMTHHAIVEAIEERDAGRAEMLLREHGRQQRLSMFGRRSARLRDFERRTTSTA